ncbi:MAG: S-formylglutathione hydrolase [Alphaproteobacteria bacterium]|jgi:S-formylglutathione hydrolase|nr:S-formylglutathione hydrolase [Alphaproteobacteria bacterium]MBT4017744.1 S-formylglutathione hydrolase [Alphaproteobacteria bacterium]MBT5159634.1 S-formylglutathione hydrolase [Alphaproteobacteria bacterium]MBT5917454.1 S-formylglutathione hydrolase [Alphaproteobacteria bacterium]MBT6384753.1 S-formylglutathione hydrolase [Alphaproteobacteria bacterium]
MTASLETISETRIFNGTHGVYRHPSQATGTDMEFSVFIPDQARSGPLPVLYYLSGLTCTWENFTAKAGAQRYATEHGVIIVAPDTSPRGDGVADDEAYDFGQGAGFYLNATQEPWSQHFHMYDYVVDELPELIAANFPIDATRAGIFGHSMGGHGALTIALKNPDKFKTVSAFSPIVAPSQVPWGHKALAGYLGPGKDTWADYDASSLIASRGWSGDILIDQGLADNFLEEQLKPEIFEQACKEAGVSLTLRRQEGYDHSYYFISTFIGDHIEWHAERLA